MADSATATGGPTTPRIGDSASVGAVVGGTVTTDAPAHPKHIAGHLIDVTVVGRDERLVEVRLADGRAGVIEASEFSSPPPVGDTLQVAVLARDDAKGRVWLSFRWARKQRAWAAITAAHASGEPISGTVVRNVKGGYLVDLGINVFLPSSLVDESPPTDPAALIGQTVDVCVVEHDAERERVVVSRREVVRRERRTQERDNFAALVVGAKVRGVVRSIKDFGALVEVDGVTGLVHRSELSWNRVRSVADVLSIGDTVDVEVIEVQKRKRRVGLSIRRCSADPLSSLEVDSVLTGVVTNIEEFGLFVRLDAHDVEGLVHRTELSELPGARPDELFMPGDAVHVRVLRVDLERRRLALSIRQALAG